MGEWSGVRDPVGGAGRCAEPAGLLHTPVFSPSGRHSIHNRRLLELGNVIALQYPRGSMPIRTYFRACMCPRTFVAAQSCEASAGYAPYSMTACDAMSWLTSLTTPSGSAEAQVLRQEAQSKAAPEVALYLIISLIVSLPCNFSVDFHRRA